MPTIIRSHIEARAAYSYHGAAASLLILTKILAATVHRPQGNTASPHSGRFRPGIAEP